MILNACSAFLSRTFCALRSPSSPTPNMAPKISVLAGPSPDQLKSLTVNADNTPLLIKTDLFEGAITVRIKGYEGPDGISHAQSGYFDRHTATFSIQISGRFLNHVSARDLVFGNIFFKPIRESLPVGVGLAMKAMTFIDPGLEYDVHCDQPWAWSPFLSTMNYITSVKLLESESPASHWKSERPQENCSSLDNHVPVDASGRRSYFARHDISEQTILEPDDVITADFCNPYIDFSDLRVHLPKTPISFSLAKAWDGQDVNFICKDRSSQKFYFMVVFRIVDEELIAALGLHHHEKK